MVQPVSLPDSSEINSENIRKGWHKGEWHHSIIDIIAELLASDYKHAQAYWSTLKHRLKKEGNQSLTFCERLKLPASDGKSYSTDVANNEQVLRLIQSIPSPKIEPMKVWLAQVGAERIREEDILAGQRRQSADYRRLIDSGFSPEEANSWIIKRDDGKKARHGVVRVWSEHGISDWRDFASLTNQVTEVAIGKTATVLKRELAITSGSLRDHLSVMELTEIGVTEYLATGLHVNRDSAGKAELSEDIEDTRPILDAARPEIERAFSKKRPMRK
jgi:DNA-damage-inducible protein D